MKNKATLTLGKSGYHVATIKIVSTGVGHAAAVLEFDNVEHPETVVVCQFDKHTDNRWYEKKCAGPRPLKQSWRLDHAINIFYDSPQLQLKAIESCGYDKDVKELLNKEKQL